MEINWAEKSLLWKMGRIFALVLYALFWLCIGMGPMYYLVSNGLIGPEYKYVGMFFVFIMFAGLYLHAIIPVEIRKRKIAEELRKNLR